MELHQQKVMRYKMILPMAILFVNDWMYMFLKKLNSKTLTMLFFMAELGRMEISRIIASLHRRGLMKVIKLSCLNTV